MDNRPSPCFFKHFIMVVLLWIINLLSPLIFIGSVVYFAFGDIETWTLIAGGGAALLGLIIGFTGWAETVPPRWFWVKSNVDLLGNRVGTALSYALKFFLIPAGVMGIIEIIEML